MIITSPKYNVSDRAYSVFINFDAESHISVKT